MPRRTHTFTQAFNLRPGMPLKISYKKRNTNDWTEIEGVVTKAVKTGPARIRITWTDRYTGKPLVKTLDAHQYAYLHLGYMQEHGITLDTRKTREEFFAASKGATL
jgi:hypothetical protein